LFLKIYLKGTLHKINFPSPNKMQIAYAFSKEEEYFQNPHQTMSLYVIHNRKCKQNFLHANIT